jgi:uncharacterized phage protein (TIGR02220 family)
MARIRTIKPEFFRNLKLYRAEVEEKLPLRLAFAGLWTASDRAGRFKWVPETLKLDCLPYDNCDFSRVLDALWTRGYIEKYALTEDEKTDFYGYVPTWEEHQHINNREQESNLPNPHECYIVTREGRVPDASEKLQRGREGNGKEGEKERNGSDAYLFFISEFNRITGKQFRGTKKDEAQYSARVKEGFTLAQFISAITNCKNDKYHIDNPKYLTPEFITRADKLQMYLNITKANNATAEPTYRRFGDGPIV